MTQLLLRHGRICACPCPKMVHCHPKWSGTVHAV